MFVKESLNKSINFHENYTFKPQINENSRDKLIIYMKYFFKNKMFY